MKKLSLLIISIFLLKALAFSQTYTLTHQLFYSTENQNMWGPNWEPFNLDFDYELFNVDWDESVGFSQMTTIFGDSIGVALDAGTWGVLASHFSMHGFTTGTVEVDYPVEIDLTFPDDYTFNPGEWIDIESEYEVLPGWDLTTAYPSAGITTLDIDFGFGAHIDLITCLPFQDCDTLHMIPPIDIPTDSITIFHINGETGYVVYPCLDENGNFDICEDSLLPIVIHDWWDIGLTGEITLPYVETTDSLGMDKCLYASGDSAYLFLNLDIVHFLSFLAGFIPPPNGPAIQQAIDYLNGSYEIDVMGATATIEWSLLQAYMDMSSTNQQDFTFCPYLWTTLDFPVEMPYYVTDPLLDTVDNGVASSITFQVDNDLHVKYPCFEWPEMDVGITHSMTNDFTNHTWDSIAFDFSMSALWFHFNLPTFKMMPEIEMPEYCIDLPSADSLMQDDSLVVCSESYHTDPVYFNKDGEKDLDYEFGPLFEWETPLGYIPFTWYDNTWNLGGFQGDTVMPPTQLVPNDPIEIFISGNDVLCYGDSTGELSVNIINGTPPYIFEWSNGHIDTTNNPSVTILETSGTYTVTVSDANSCSLTESITIIDLNPEIFANLSATDVLCHGENTGTANVAASGGTPGYTYLWDPSGDVSANITDLYAGWQTVTVTDAIGCIKVDSTFIDEPASEVSIDLVPTHVSCNGGSDGSIDMTVYGGTPDYSYMWNNGSTLEDLFDIPAGTYTVVVTDDNACAELESIEVTQPDVLDATILGTDVGCYGEINGAADLTVSGGTPPYTYNWSSGSTNEDLTAITGGDYTVTVTDAQFCTVVEAIHIYEPSQPVSIELEGTDVLCKFDHTGAVDLTVTGGTPDYSYDWSNGDNTEDIENIPAGSYTVTVTDDHGCVETGTITIIEPAQALNSILIPHHVRCFGENSASINLTASGGTAPYSYLWSEGSTTQDIDGLVAGEYSVIITDDHACTLIDEITITEPDELLASFNPINILCYGDATGEIDLTVTGGVQPYSYNWNTGQVTEDISSLVSGYYSVTVTDDHECFTEESIVLTQPFAPLNVTANVTDVACYGDPTGAVDIGITGGTPSYSYEWSTGHTIQDVQNLLAGDYTLTVTDDHQCQEIENITIGQPAEALQTDLIATDILCHGDYTGSIDMTIWGGTPDYLIEWNNDAGAEDISDLPAGNYSVTVTDENACVATDAIYVNEPDKLIMEAIDVSYICTGDTAHIQASATGGVPGYTYLWNTGYIANILPVSPHADITYSVYAQDANGCTSNPVSANVEVFGAIQVSLAQEEYSICPGDPVDLDLNVSGGNTNYSYTITGPDTVWYFSDEPDIIYPQESGTYLIKVKDDCNSPSGFAEFVVTVHEFPGINIQSNRIDGCEPLTVYFNEITPYNGQMYLWNFDDPGSLNFSTDRSPTHTFANAGSYNVSLTVTSPFGCISMHTMGQPVTVYPTPIAGFEPDHSVVSLVDPVIYFQNTSFGGMYSTWYFGDGVSSDERSPEHYFTNFGTYHILLIEESANGCVDSISTEIQVKPELTFYAPTAFIPDDDGFNDLFSPMITGMKEGSFEMAVYNRWGEKVFETDKYDVGENGEVYMGWDGKDMKDRLCKSGVYTWKVSYRDLYDVKYDKVGAVTLLR